MSEPPITVVTGARTGIGRALAEHCLARGHRVVGCSRGEAGWHAPNYEHHRLDVGDEAAAVAFFARLGQVHGRVDHLINNAGVAAMNHSLLTPGTTVEAILRTNVAGTFFFAREAAKLMLARRSGRIVNLASVTVPLKLEGEAVYAASKAAVVTLTEILARELAPSGITVNAVGPTAVETDMIRGVPKAMLARALARQAIPRAATAADVANVVDFFLSPASAMVTGQVVYLGGV